MSTKKNNITKEEAIVDLKKREFMGKFGKYATVGAGMAILMTPSESSATGSGTTGGTFPGGGTTGGIFPGGGTTGGIFPGKKKK